MISTCRRAVLLPAAAALLGLGSVAQPARAAFTPLDDFSEADGTTLAGKSSDLAGAAWSADTGIFTVQGGVAVTSTGNKRSMITVPVAQAIADNSVGTLFFQIVGASGQFTFGPSDNNASNDAYNVNHPLAPLTLGYPSGATGALISGGTVGTGYTAGQTYSVWVVMNTAADTYDLYIQGGTQYPTQTQLVSNQPFVNAQSAAVRYFAFRTNSFTGSVGFDNLYIDSSAANLADPLAVAIPAPAALPAGLGLLGGLGLLRRRR